ncbi:PAS domain-containing sensor histidine kinase [Clostridium sp. LBM24168]
MVDTFYFSTRGVHSSLFRDSGGGFTKLTIIIAVVFIICDFTIKIKSKSEESRLNLIKSEERYRLIFENMIDAYFEINTDGIIIKVSPSVRYSFGYTQHYMEGKNFYNFFVNPIDIKNIVEKIYSIGRVMNIEALGIKKNGGLIYFLLVGDVSLNPENDEKIIIINARNITDYKMEEKIRLNLAANLEAVFESSRDFIWTVDGQTYKIISFNSAYKNFLSDVYSIKVNRGDRIEKIIPYKKVKFFKELYKRVLIKGNFTVEYTDEKSNSIFELTLYPININNNKRNISIFARDITSQKKAELKIRSLNEGLEEMVEDRTKELVNAYNDLESFSYTVSHEFKTPIREIDAYLTIIEEDCLNLLPQTSKNDILSVKKICKETLDMIQKMMEYCKAGYMAINPKIINMNQLVRECYNDIKLSYNNKVIILQISDLPELFADKFLIKQAIFNIMSNSIKFSRNNKKIIIEIGYVKDKNNIVYYFKDNGVGFDSDFSNNLFVLFNRLHNNNEFEGNGIGLATVKRIIERNGGTVDIHGEKGNGCIVFFKFKKSKNLIGKI